MNLSKINIIKIGVCILLMTTANSCQKYLTVEPIDRLTGNNFYLSKQDVESNIAFIYSKFFEKINETWVMGAIGEARSGEIFVAEGANNYNSRLVIEELGKNNLNNAIFNSQFNMYNLGVITNWQKYYQVIQSVNILIEKLDEGIPGVSESDYIRYKAEATFIRCFTYFWMVRLYGDVVYYTEPYQRESMPRENMVSVLNKCIAELTPQKELMPWTPEDPANRGARPSKGGIIALLMHMNMWNSSFDRANSTKYYEETAKLGDELIGSGVHRLYPLNDEAWSEVMKGRTEESLFEFYRSINYNDNVAALAPFWDHFLRWPYKFPRFVNNQSHTYFISTYMNKIFPDGDADLRRDLWFEDIDSDNGLFVLRKYGTNIYASGNEDKNPDITFMIFRYADAILLHAEALAELNRDVEAIASLNLIRERAQATPYNSGGGAELKDFIHLERCRELIGESHRYFDLIRTRRILNSEWTLAPMNLDQYNRGAWTWPINQSALFYNREMTLNEYWINVGR